MNPSEIHIPLDLLEQWQSFLDDLTEKADIPFAAMTRIDLPHIEVLLSSNTMHTPLVAGFRGIIAGSYCERVVSTGERLLVPDATIDPEWDHNPDIKYNLIAYLGVPIRCPDGSPFGTLCILDTHENSFGESSQELLSFYQGMIEEALAALSDTKN